MSQINKLYRNFIILQEDERVHSSTSDKTLSGYSKIEAKGERCKVSFYAQNLRKDSTDYNIMLICNNRDSKKLIDLGEVTIGDSGKVECTKEYFIDNIAGLDMAFDKISGATIVKMKDGIPIFIMYGFINGNQPSDNWKNYKITKAVKENNKVKVEMPKKDVDKKHDKKKEFDGKKHKKENENEYEYEREKEIVKEIEKEVDKKEIINIKVDPREKFEDYEASIKTNEYESEREKEIVKEVEIEKEVGEEVDKKEIINIKVDPRGKFEDYETSIKTEEVNLDKYSDEFEVRGSVGEYFEGIAKGFEKCKDKYKEIKYCKWYKVNVNDLYEMCNMSNYNKYTVAYYPMLNYYPYIKKYGKFMLGYKCDKEGNLKYIVYGVPGKKDRDEQPYEGKTGFVTWISDDDENREDMGCWLMFYDFKNSTVVVPMQ